MYEELVRDYDQLCRDLTARFGTDFEIISTGGGFWAMAADIEGGYALVTSSHGSDGLLPRAEMEGWGVGAYIGGEEKVWINAPEPKGLLLFTDDDTDVTELGDLIQKGLRALTFQPGTSVRHSRWPDAATGKIMEFPAVDDTGFANIDLAAVDWPEGLEIENIRDLV